VATFEEKILAYLDDSLSGEEREDVLRETQASTPARALFDAHVRLGSLYALAAKPIGAPLALQRELASKVPVLALKLPYLAMPEKRRKRALAWLWELPSFRMNALLVLLAALLAGGVWFAVRGGQSGLRGPVSQKFSSQPATTDGPSVSGKTPQNISSPIANVARASTAPHIAISGKTHASDWTHTTHSTKFQKITLPQNVAVKERFATQQPTFAEPAPPAALALRAIEVSQPPAMFHAAGAIPIFANPAQENSYTPVRVFVAEDIRSTRLAPQTNPSEVVKRYGLWQTNVMSEGMEFGIDFETSPWMAFGLRAGDAQFVQEQQVLHLVTKSGSYPHLTSEVTETALLGPFAPWACAAATYTPNPGERLQYSFTAAAGDIFLSGFSPTILGEGAAIYSFNDAFGLRASFSYQAAWVTSANPIEASPPQGNSNVSGSSVQSVTSKLYPSQSLGFSLGVTFHP